MRGFHSNLQQKLWPWFQRSLCPQSVVLDVADLMHQRRSTSSTRFLLNLASTSRLATSVCLGLLLQCLVLLSPAAAERVSLGVVRSSDNAADWESITTRLQAAKVGYRVVDFQQVQRAADLNGISVLFLPNVETVTETQAIALEEWMSRGGRVVVSGPVGRLSPLGVRQALRSLLGAYWAYPLSEPNSLQTITMQPQSWARKGQAATGLWGGVIMPSSLSSQTIATWKNATGTNPAATATGAPSDTPPAIVTTERSTFFGWNWGRRSSGSPEFDGTWLRAALSRYGEVPIVTVPVAAAPSPATTANSTVPKPTVGTSTLSIPLTSVSPTGSTALRQAPATVFQPRAQSTNDPAEQVAPPGIEVEAGALPIATLEAIAMRQELENLIGRVSSALLAADAINSTNNSTANLNLPANSSEANLVASSQELGVATAAEASNSKAISTTEQVVAEARQGLRKFSQLVAQGDYRNARSQWLQTRRFLWDNYPTERLRTQPEVRAIWLDRGTIVRAGSEQGLSTLFDRLAASGINTIFFETVNAGYTIYPSQVAPQQNPLTRGWDPLASAVKLAHARGMELHAWVWAFAAGNDRHNALLNLPLDYPGPVISAHPDWANYDNRGRTVPAGQGKPFLDPANPEVRRYLLQLLGEIASRYQVDGIQLDYIRYPFQDPSAGRTYGYGKAAREQFQQLAGVDPLKISPSDRNLWQRWTNFRTQQIDSFVAEAAQSVRRVKPSLVMSVAVFPLPQHERIQKLQQHWEVWAERGDINLVVPMAYAMDTNRFQRLVQPYLTSSKLNSTLILPGIRLLNLPEAVAIDQIQALRDLPSGGYSLFAAENFNDRLQTIFQKTQGPVQRIPREPIPYRQPFAAAAVRYATMQREWSFLQAQRQLWMREPTLSRWQNQSKALNQSLQALAERPGRDRLKVARRELTNYRAQFRSWMNLYALEHGYQVEAWEHRLESIDTLLNYGERVTFSSSSNRAANQSLRP
ncbi:MAG: family 10 glycosylhydrolase [Trichocoleus desertorum ATA4-8-CV12]|nr:family 10 glycosylhydrolase [Trichocoleus desertorum ATA4-8-CV12]